jgi:uncharacterized protein
METVAHILWRRLDSEGHDASRLVRESEGWRLVGMAVFEHDGQPAALAYSVRCDSGWRTHSATVDGWVAGSQTRIDIVRTEDGTWLLDDEDQPSVSGCIDLDLAFTPSTNLLPLRRLNLAIGSQTPAPAAYLRFPDMRLELLEQTYERTGPGTYVYSAPAFEYAQTLDVAESGFVAHYPLLWECVSHHASESGRRSGV